MVVNAVVVVGVVGVTVEVKSGVVVVDVVVVEVVLSSS